MANIALFANMKSLVIKMKNAILLILLSLCVIGCARLETQPELRGGYLPDELWHECRDGLVWAVNDHGAVNLETPCGEG